MQNASRIREWYDNRARERGHGSWRPVRCYRYFLDIVRRYVKSGVLFDAGCGTGEFLSLAADHYGVSGCDISPVSVALTNGLVGDGVVHECRMEDLGKGDYGVVTALGSLEHCESISAGIAGLKRVGADGAVYLVVVPNSHFPLAGTDQQEINETLKSRVEWEQLFESHGFVVKEVLKDMSLPLKYDGPKRWFRWFGAAALVCLPLDMTYQFVFVMTKQPE